MDVKVAITSERLSDVDLQSLTQQLCTTIVQEAGLDAEMAEQPGSSDTRGAEVALGTIALAFLTSGSAVALFNVFKSYFDRESSLEIELERPDGRRFRMSAQNVGQSHLNRTLQGVQEFLRDP